MKATVNVGLTVVNVEGTAEEVADFVRKVGGGAAGYYPNNPPFRPTTDWTYRPQITCNGGELTISAEQAEEIRKAITGANPCVSV